MKNIIAMSLKECISFTLESSVNEEYIIISIQDSQNGGFGLIFTETNYCKAVHTCYFDDIDRFTPNLCLISEEQAKNILKFVEQHKEIKNIVIHCLYGQCRSVGVAAALAKIYNKDDSLFFTTKTPNMYVYRTLLNQHYSEGCEVYEN